MDLFRGEDDGVSPVIGVVLMVAITVALAAVVAIVVTSSSDQLNEGNANVKAEFQSTSTGLVLKIEQISTDAKVQINGETIQTVSKDAAGKTISLPSAPGDKIVLVSGDRRSSVLISKTVDESESPDFIAYYRMNEETDSSTVEDHSGNENTGEVRSTSAIDFTDDGAAKFKSTGDPSAKIVVPDLDTSKTVDEMTIALDYKLDDSSPDGEILEQNVGAGALRFTHRLDGSGGHTMEVGYPDVGVTARKKVDNDNRQVSIMTYDGTDLVFYQNGEKVDTVTDPDTSTITLGQLTLGKDPCFGCGQHFYGKMYEFRMYYKAFDEGEVDTLFTSLGG